MKYTCMAYLINRSCILRKEFLRKKMVLHNILTFNVDTAAAVKLKLPFKAGSGISCAGAGSKLWPLFGTWKEL